MLSVLRSSFICLSTTIMLLPVFASAVTINVATYGEDNGGGQCGATNKPCRSISFAIALAAKNDTVLVHSGTYTENIEIATEGLQLVSTKGRYATIIKGSSRSNPTTVNIAANRVRLGRRLQGFSIQNSLGQAGSIRTDTKAATQLTNVTVEGNYLGVKSAAADLPTSGGVIDLSGLRHQIRFNRLVSGASGGYFCLSCPAVVFTDNQSRNGGPSLSYYVTAQNEANPESSGNAVVLRNTDINGGGFEVHLLQNSRFQDNVSFANTNDEPDFGIVSGSGSVVSGNISTAGRGIGIVEERVPLSAAPRIYENNLSVASANIGLWFSLTPGAVARNNTAVSSKKAGMAVENWSNDLPLRFFGLERNSTWSTGSGIGVLNDTQSTLLFEKHFFGGGDRAATNNASYPVQGSRNSTPNATDVRTASGL